MEKAVHRTLKKLFIILCLMVPLSVAAESGIARAWKKFDNWLERSQLMGIDTNYVQLPKLNHQAYIGSYTYWQGYQMTMPFFMEDATTILPGIKDKDHYRLNAHTWQGEIELGLDWKGLALELPIPIYNNYRYSLGLAKNGSIWGARFRYKHLRQMDGNCNVGDLSLNNDKNNINIFFIEGYYVLMHKKFSLSAGLYADMVQRRSAGSPLIYPNYYHSSYNLEDLFPANYDSFRTNQAGVPRLRGAYVLHLQSLEAPRGPQQHVLHLQRTERRSEGCRQGRLGTYGRTMECLLQRCRQRQCPLPRQCLRPLCRQLQLQPLHRLLPGELPPLRLQQRPQPPNPQPGSRHAV